MKRYTPEELTEILRLHHLWLQDEEGGVRANLVRANLAGANLAGANLDGANLDGVNLDGARGFRPFICIGPIGSRRGYTTIYLTEDRVCCGCFDGTLEEFEAEVKDTHAKNPLYLAEYTALIAMARNLRETHLSFINTTN